MSAWKDHVTASLIGCGKTAPPELPAALQPALGDTTAMEAEARFLTQAGALAMWREAGWTPAHNATEISAADPEKTAAMGRASVGHLHSMLAGRCLSVFSEWLGEVSRRGRHLPPEILPALLDRARQQPELRPLVIAAGGQRAAWLAAQNPAWSFASHVDPELWETGSREQRVAILRHWREQSPAEARAKLEAVWAAEPAENRVEFLMEFSTNLSLDDALFLERALSDRSKDVRLIAFSYLSNLPASPFVERMTARAAPLLRFSRGGLLSRATLEVTLPPDPDAAARRDGLDPKVFGPQGLLGERAVLLVVLLSAVPLRYWTETFQQAPETLVKAAEKNEFARALVTGWTWAATHQRDVPWAEALLDSAVKPRHEFRFQPEALYAVLPTAARAARLVPLLRQVLVGELQAAAAFRPTLSTFEDYLPMTVARDLLAILRREAAQGVPSNLEVICELVFLRLPPSMLDEAATGWPVDKEGVAPLMDLLTFRHEALTALHQS